MSAKSKSASPSFLAGGGELGERMRTTDWSGTPLGNPDSWPQSLKTAVRIMLMSRQPIWIGWGPELTYLYNDPYKSIIGGKHPVALGQPARIVWKEIWPVIGPMLDSATDSSEGTYVEEQLLIMERNGYPEETYYTYSYTPIPDDQGKNGGIICANTDDTQRVISKRQLATVRELAAATADLRTWRDVCQHAMHGLSSNPRDLVFGLIYIANEDRKSAMRVAMSGISPAHALAPEAIDLSDPHAAWPVSQAIQTHSEVVVDADPTSNLPAGAWHRGPARVMVLPIFSSDDGRQGALVVGLNPFRKLDSEYRDFLQLLAGQISASMAIADAYSKAQERAESLTALDRAKTAFFSNISHEFRTPLTLMLAPTEDALAQADKPEQRERLEIVRRNAMRLQRLVNSLLDFSRIEAGRVKAYFEPVNIVTLTSELASVFRSTIERAGMKLQIHAQGISGDSVYVDRDMFEKIILNLISNAFKFTFEGEIAVEITDQRDHVQIQIRDTGIGIAADQLPHLFERFHRVEGARSRTYEGSGIGLALVHELVKVHHGKVEVTSELNRGTTFTLALPKGSAHLPPEHLGPSAAEPSVASREAFVQEASRWSVDENQATPEPVPGGMGTVPSNEVPTVLVADDNQDMREYVSRLLAPVARIRTASDGAAALAFARTSNPDLIVTDIMMPGMDGFGLIKNIREDEVLRETPLIVLSARAGEEARVEGLQAGADDYLVKPFSGRELIARVTAHLQMARMRREGEERERALRHEAEVLNEVALTIGAELDLNALVQKVTDLARELTHAAFAAFFYNTIDNSGESYLLYTLSGAPREAFEKFGMPRATHLFGPTFRGEAVIRIADVLKDSRYGKNPPHHGMPKGHLPVRSYLAAPVISRSGEVIGGLFFGHPTPDVFSARDERIAAGIAAEAAVAIDNARLFGEAQREINERKLAEAQVRTREKQLQALLDQAPMGIFLVDSKLIIRHVNPIARPVLGDRDDLIGSNFVDVMKRMWSPRTAKQTTERFEHTLATGESYHHSEFSDQRIDRPGTEYYEWHIHRVPLPDGQMGVVCYFSDISLHIRARDALSESENRLRGLVESERAARAEAERAGRMKDEFLATLSHELRTPLNAILGWTHLLRKSPGISEEVEKGATVIERNARVQVQLISDLLDMSRIISGKMRLDVQRVELPAVIAAAIESISPAADAKGVRLQNVIEPIAAPVNGDPARIQQIVWNLLSNAVKFTPRGGRVQVVLAQVNSHVEITISDTGRGIKPDFLPHVFERFRQADSSAAREYGGLGLGLSIARQLAELHGGTLLASSNGLDKGSTFTFTLPLAAVRPTTASEHRVHPHTVALSAVEYVHPDLAGVRVLVVDDEPDAREIVKRVLEECSATVDVAGSASEARAQIKSHSPDVILSDIGMPGEDGYSLIQSLRAAKFAAPAAAMTAFARTEDRTRALLAGYQIHIAKPVEPAELTATVAALASRAKSARP